LPPASARNSCKTRRCKCNDISACDSRFVALSYPSPLRSAASVINQHNQQLLGQRSPATTLERRQVTKAELIDSVAKSAGVSKADTERTIGAFFDTRTGRNPQTGTP
jgi:hypothetical protein